MKKLTFLLGITFWSLHALCQTKLDDLYLRSSLQTILIESESFPQKDAVIKSWNGYPFPDKYDKHGIDYPTINLSKFVLSDIDLKESGYLKDTLSGFALVKAQIKSKNLRYLAADSSVAFELPSEREEVDMRIKKAMKTDFFPNLLLQRWYDFDANSKTMSFNVFKKRANYNATNSDYDKAKNAVDKNALVNSVMQQLLSNTFVTFTKLNFIENEPTAKLVRDAAILAINRSDQQEMVKDLGRKAAEKVYQKTKDGYTLSSKTWLYKIAWNDSIQTYFYKNLWANVPDLMKTVESFLKGERVNLTPSQISFLSGDPAFKMEFVNDQVNTSIFLFAEGKTIEQIIDKVLVRNIDNAFAKLQKENDVFKPLVKILSKEPLTAEIGMKEGLEGGEKFEVLELQEEAGTGNILFKKVSTVKVVKGKVWDNRYNAGEKPKNEDGTDLVQNEYTEFKGDAKNGTFLRLIK
jgi:hypothetical protein